MKKNSYYFGLLAVLGGLILQGCHASSKVESPQSSTQLSSTASTTTVSSSDEIEQWLEQYATVFEDYQLIYSHRDDSDYVDYVALSEQLHTPINIASLENSINSPDNLRYAFYDLDKNGQKELFIGSLSTDNTVYIKGMYYLNGTSPAILGESFVGSGSARGSAAYYDDGSVLQIYWSPGNGDAKGTLSQLQANNTIAVEIETKDGFRIPGTDTTELFGKSEGAVVDGSAFDWKEFDFTTSTATQTTTTTSQIFPTELIGTWKGTMPEQRNYAGDEVTMTFTEDGTIYASFSSSPSTAYVTRIESLDKVGDNLYKYNVAEGSSSSALLLGAQIGGYQMKYAFGFMLVGDMYYVKGWQAQEGEEFDFQPPESGKAIVLYRQSP